MIVYYKIYASISGGAAVSDLRGCCNNLPHTQWLKTPETCFLTNLEAMGMKLSLPPPPRKASSHVEALGENLFLASPASSGCQEFLACRHYHFILFLPSSPLLCSLCVNPLPLSISKLVMAFRAQSDSPAKAPLAKICNTIIL